MIARVAALAYVGVAAYATRVAIEDGVPARFAGRAFPGSPAQQFAWAGTGLSAPAYVLAGYATAAVTGNARRIGALAATTFAGQIGEPVTYTAGSTRQRAIVAANLTLPAVMLVALWRQARSGSRSGSSR